MTGKFLNIDNSSKDYFEAFLKIFMTSFIQVGICEHFGWKIVGSGLGR